MADMKIDKGAVIEVALGFLISGLILMVISSLIGGWLTAQGAKITGKNFDGSDFEKDMNA